MVGNMTEEGLEQILQQDSVPETASKSPGGETTHARKEVTPGMCSFMKEEMREYFLLILA